MFPLEEGVAEVDVDAIGGSDSKSEAPKDDVGLNGFNPANPVICGWSELETDIEGIEGTLIMPVG